MYRLTTASVLVGLLGVLPLISGCSGMSSNSMSTNGTSGTSGMTATPSVLSQLTTKTTIGSTVDPVNGDNNPYGLAIAPSTSGPITAGDLIVCNFNNKAGTSGAGTTIEDLAPTASSTPKRIAQDSSLAGCDALALGSTDAIWAAAYTANDNPHHLANRVCSLDTRFQFQLAAALGADLCGTFDEQRDHREPDFLRLAGRQRFHCFDCHYKQGIRLQHYCHRLPLGKISPVWNPGPRWTDL